MKYYEENLNLEGNSLQIDMANQEPTVILT